MPVPPAAARNSGRNRPDKARQIRRAARRLLFLEGPRGLTMDAVAHSAHVSKTTLYALYRSRHELLADVVTDEASRIDISLGSPPQTRRAVVADLERFVLSLHSFLAGSRHARLMQAMGQAAPPARDLGAVYRHGPRRSHERLAEYLRQASRKGLVACSDPHHAAELLLGMAMGLDLVRAMYRQRSPHAPGPARSAHARRVVAAFLALCGPASAPGPGQAWRRSRQRRDTRYSRGVAPGNG
jgi:TetR/AcrR family transcriptional repressor of mexJK operon